MSPTRLVLLPGMDGSGTLSAEFVEAMRLSSEPTVVAYPADRALGYKELEAFVRSKLPTDRPYVLIAESFSGPIAIAIAASNPTGLVALVLVCTFVRCPIRLPKRIARGFLNVPVWPILNTIAARFVLGSFSTASLRTQIVQAASNVSSETWRTRLRSVMDVDVASDLRKIRMPVLYLRAARDRVVPRPSGDEVLRGCPGSRIVEIDGPHFLLLAKPHQSAAAVRAFASESALTL